ncbi:DNA-directed RNA polymerase subunit delta [Dietzia cinnamea]|nr:DNA-directed RNA polymerase subunit delta [Dietzia cinnamea]
MSLNRYSKEELQEMSLIEVAFEILKDKKQAITFQELMAEIKKVMKLDEAEVTERMVQFYTDINIYGRFMSQGEGRWGLRVWYPVDQIEEDNVTTVKPKKKKSKKAVDEDDLDLDEFDEIDEEDLDFDDDIEEFDEDDDDLDDDDDDDDEEFDEDIEDTDDFEDEDELLEDEDEDHPLEEEDIEDEEEEL